MSSSSFCCSTVDIEGLLSILQWFRCSGAKVSWQVLEEAKACARVDVPRAMSSHS